MENQNNLVSVIVPIYNVEPYLRKCVDSILAQTYINLEVILVDDGSPDGCPAICDEYKEKDERVKVIHKSNGGLSDARNAGLDAMTGEYVTFVDSDDWLEFDVIQTLVNEAASNMIVSIEAVSVKDEQETYFDRGIKNKHIISAFEFLTGITNENIYVRRGESCIREV